MSGKADLIRSGKGNIFFALLIAKIRTESVCRHRYLIVDMRIQHDRLSLYRYREVPVGTPVRSRPALFPHGFPDQNQIFRFDAFTAQNIVRGNLRIFSP